jgi:uncharacterized protein
MEKKEQVLRALKEAGFTYVTLDLQGYRTGAMNEVLEKEQKRGATHRNPSSSAD